MKKSLLGFSGFMLIFLALSSVAFAETCTEYLYPPGTSDTHRIDAYIFHSLASKNGFAYTCFYDGYPDSYNQLQCFELGASIYNHPVNRSRIFLPVSSSRIVLMDDYAVLAMGSLGLGLVGISNPDQMSDVSLTATGDVCRDLALLGADHVVTAEWSAVRIYDLRDPAAPVEISGVALSQARTVAVAGDLVLVACGNLGLAIVDISNPSMPSLVKQFPVGGFVDRVAAEGNLVYLTGYLIGLVTVDVSTPTTPHVVDTLPLVGEPEAIVIRGGYAYIPVDEAVTVIPELPDFDAMALVRLNKTGTPAVIDYYFPDWDYSVIALGDDMVLLGGDITRDITLAQLQCPDVSDVPVSPATNLSLSPPWPNPFNPRVNVRFNLPEDLAGQLRVHDLRGNLIAEIWRGTGTGREMNAVWNGVDQAGRACPSGTYAFILSDLAGRQSNRVTGTLLR